MTTCASMRSTSFLESRERVDNIRRAVDGNARLGVSCLTDRGATLVPIPFGSTAD